MHCPRSSVLFALPLSLLAARPVPPLIFEPVAAATFLARHAGGTVTISGGLIDFGALRMFFAGANPRAGTEPLEPQPGKSFYYSGSDPREWRAGVPQYGRVALRQVYPGVDVLFHGGPDQLEYDFILAPHADLQKIRLRFEGARALRLDPSGDLLIDSAGSVLRHKRPYVYQESGGRRRELAGRYTVAGREARFTVPGYDPSLPLVVDPVIVFATYFGGSGDDVPSAIALDAAGNIYLAGYTNSSNFPAYPATTGAALKGAQDAFVVKLDPEAQHILYSVVLGGSSYDGATAIAVDASGNGFITGGTASTDFPTLNA